MPRPGPRAAPREPLSRERILRAAIDRADHEGIAALSMRRLAQDLGVEAMTLYHYVRNKDDLVGGALDLVLGEVTDPSPTTPWPAAIRHTATALHETLVRHPWATGVLFSAPTGTARFRTMEALLGTLRRAGFTAQETHLAYHVLDSHIVGHAMWEVGITISQPDLAGLAAAFLATLDRSTFPHLAEHVEQHLRPEDGPGSFDYGLTLILEGLERRRGAS